MLLLLLLLFGRLFRTNGATKITPNKSAPAHYRERAREQERKKERKQEQQRTKNTSLPLRSQFSVTCNSTGVLDWGTKTLCDNKSRRFALAPSVMAPPSGGKTTDGSVIYMAPVAGGFVMWTRTYGNLIKHRHDNIFIGTGQVCIHLLLTMSDGEFFL